MIVTAADTCCITTAGGSERACATDGKRFAYGTCLNAWIFIIESLNSIGACNGDGGITITGKACPIGAGVVTAIDGNIFQLYAGTCGYANLVIAGQGARKHIAILGYVITTQSCKIDSWIHCQRIADCLCFISVFVAVGNDGCNSSCSSTFYCYLASCGINFCHCRIIRCVSYHAIALGC